MSTIERIVKEVRTSREKAVNKTVTNFMGGNSYEINAIDTMKMVTASSIFGEPQYYRDGAFKEKAIKDGLFCIDRLVAEDSILSLDKFKGAKTSEVMEKIINEALDTDFGAVIDWAIELRKTYNMRLNPQVIMVLAANHPKRVEFNEKNPGVFTNAQKLVMSRADEPASQLAYQLYKYGKKNSLPNILKRTWAEKLSGLNRYQVAKYKNTGLGMIDVVRISHAHSEVLDELMKNGTVEVSEDDKTWENLRSAGKTWTETLDTIKLGHMALLRNLRNIFTEINDTEKAKAILDQLKGGVLDGKQFPFRYYTAYKMLENTSINHLPMVLDALEDCMDISLENMPKLKGKTITLTDNSGSAWGTLNSEYGTTKVAEIDNVSAVITAMLSDEGYVGVFGDRLEIIPIKKRDGILSQVKKVSEAGKHIGGSTENGIWLFFDQAVKNAEHWDNIFIYSDMQAGHGGLYGVSNSSYRNSEFDYHGHIDVNKLLKTYRSKVFSKVNMFSVQTAGYNNVLIPEYVYRANYMYGWTGKEVLFADTMIKFWDQKEAQKQ